MILKPQYMLEINLFFSADLLINKENFIRLGILSAN